MTPDLLGVVVPARDEATALPGCLASLARATAHPELAGTPVLVVVVADRCTDDTADLAAAAGALVVTATGETVGDARHAGALAVLARAPRPERVWLASTDADSLVPEGWLAMQRAAAESGVHALVGLVEVADWSGHPPHVAAAFTDAYDDWRRGGPGAVHPHVHGANLGVRGDAYLRAGGFPPLAVSEDAALVGALTLSGATVLRTPGCPVATSARRDPRAPGGFGTDLDRLAGD
ncbi:Glycosyl transferase family 2 [Klenkia marina]|uniref:4,4'-diaponeurosporenoate glycosyltransferase n=1 Tax=Klenkia marina TaxID=1960309 RepID=A0A1G4Y9H3_9ACTN|nr:glycosyltransferase [Klenkia marina]SCX50147.1 Glycosyl transferase family 2 [Klenkia marina]